ncbi:hypothetical protein ACFVP3_36420 [Streptomyces sp. NPDC057806]|uniref:hypothetical protein n=1 Tax=Streptomyces sp. NPDC057806 TaxID=3346255 RepID=UPI0036C51870
MTAHAGITSVSVDRAVATGASGVLVAVAREWVACGKRSVGSNGSGSAAYHHGEQLAPAVSLPLFRAAQTWKARLAELLVGYAGVVILVPGDVTWNGPHVITDALLSLVTFIHTIAVASGPQSPSLPVLNTPHPICLPPTYPACIAHDATACGLLVTSAPAPATP